MKWLDKYRGRNRPCNCASYELQIAILHGGLDAAHQQIALRELENRRLRNLLEAEAIDGHVTQKFIRDLQDQINCFAARFPQPQEGETTDGDKSKRCPDGNHGGSDY